MKPFNLLRYTKAFAYTKALASVVFMVSMAMQAFGQSEIFLRPNMVSPTAAQKLVDGKTQGADSYWIPDWQSNAGDDDRLAIIDLGREYESFKLEWYDFQDKGDLIIDVAPTDTSSFTNIFTGKTNDYLKWNSASASGKVRYIKVNQEDHGAIISEIRAYGTPSGTVVIPAPTEPGSETATLDELTDSTATVTFEDLEPGKSYSVELNARELLTFDSPISGHDTIRPPDTVTYTPDTATVTFDQMAGMCLLPDDPLSRARAGGYVRPYILSKWYLYDVQNVSPNLQIKDWEMAFCPSYAGGWCQDPFYQSFSDAGLEVVPTFKESFMFLTNNDKPSLDNKPRKMGSSGLDPNSWKYMSAYFYQFAARYGKTRVPQNFLLLRDDQKPITGAGWVNYMQLENEWDKWWLGLDSEFTASEYAAYHSACYDGHMQTITDPSPRVRFGIVNADSTMKVVLGPMAHLDYTKLDSVFAWWDANRTDTVNYKKYPLDAISFHRYANTSGPKQRALNGKGQSPEAFGFYEYAKEFVDYAHAKGLEAWITEFGYDTNSKSPQGIVPFAGKSTEEIQAEWLCRTYLIFAAAGIDRAAMYMMRDVTEGGSGIFQTSGFTSTNGSGHLPKTSWYYFSTMVEALKGSLFKEWETSGQEGVYKYRFERDTTNIYAVWYSTADGTTDNAYTMSVDGTNATMITPIPGDDDGTSVSLTVSGGNVTIPVSEKPRFIVVTP